MSYSATIYIYDGKYKGRSMDVELSVTVSGTLGEIRKLTAAFEEGIVKHFGKNVTFSTGITEIKKDKKSRHGYKNLDSDVRGKSKLFKKIRQEMDSEIATQRQVRNEIKKERKLKKSRRGNK